jgi:uncharacterized protein GlcG (DUF336 family)
LGIELDGLYSLDRVITDKDELPEELIAAFAAEPFAAPANRRADRIFVVGKSLRYSDVDAGDFPEDVGEISPINEANLLSLPPFTAGPIRSGVQYGTTASGFVESVHPTGVPIAIAVNADGSERIPLRAGSPLAGGVQLRPEEVRAILDSAIFTAFRTRAAIRRPLDSAAQVSIWVVDTQGTPIGFVRAKDAPLFGMDVALQKARSAMFMSAGDSASLLNQSGLGSYVAASRSFVGPQLFSGTTAFTARALGNLSRPFYPDGIRVPGVPGPFSLPLPEFAAGIERSFSPFNTGLQLDLILSAVAAPLAGVIPNSCTAGSFGRKLQNGLQIFPGGVPLYRGNTLVGGLGVSGDGIDQDDLIAFYSASRAGLDAVGRNDVGDQSVGFHAPVEMRADRLTVAVNSATRLRYVNCPEAPFRDDNVQSVCVN